MDAETPLAAQVRREHDAAQFAERIAAQQSALAIEVAHGRIAAHAKHGAQSIEGQSSGDRLLAILTEEVGEVARAMNEYALGNLTHEEAGHAIRSELVDVITVASAWAVKFDQEQERIEVYAQDPEEAAQIAQGWLTGRVR